MQIQSKEMTSFMSFSFKFLSDMYHKIINSECHSLIIIKKNKWLCVYLYVYLWIFLLWFVCSSRRLITYWPLHSLEWSRSNFSLQSQYDIKQTGDENKEKCQ